MRNFWRIFIKRSVAISLVIALIISIIVFFAPVGPVLSSWAEKRIGTAIDANVTIEGLDFRLYGFANARRVTIEPAGLPDERIVIDDVTVMHRLGALLRGRYQADRIMVGNVTSRASTAIIEWALSLGGEGKTVDAFPDLEIAGGFLDLSEFVSPFYLERIHISAKQQEDGDISGRASFLAGKNDVGIVFNANIEQGFVKTEISVTGFDLAFLPQLEIAGFSVDPSQVKVSGDLSGTLTYLTSAHRWVGDLALTGVVAGHPRSGLVVANGHSNIQIDDRKIIFHGTKFLSAEGQISIPSAEITLGRKSIDNFRFYGTAKGLNIASLENLGFFKMLAESYQPARVDSGKIDASINGMWNSAQGFNYHADLDIREASGTLKEPKVDFSSFDAQAVVATGEKVTVKKASARFWGGRAEITGTFDLYEGDVQNPDVDIAFEGVVKNDTLMAMLPEDVVEGIDFAGISKVALADGNIRLIKDHISLNMTISAEKLTPLDLPFEFDDAVGTVKWDTDATSVVFEDVSGETDGRLVQGFGALLIEEELYRADFTVWGEDIGLSRDLLEWLNIDILQWQVDGAFDINLQAKNWRPVENSVIDSLSGIQSDIDLKGASLSHPDYGMVAEKIDGLFKINSNGIDLQRFTGALFGIDVEGKGGYPVNYRETPPYLSITSEAFPLSSELAGRLPLDKIESMDGHASFAGKIVALPVDDNFEFSGEFTTHLDNAWLTASGLSAGASGSSHFQFSSEGLSGRASLNDITIGNFKGEDLAAEFNYFSPELVFRNITISGYGGRIDAKTLRIDMIDNNWATQFYISGMDLQILSETHDIMRKQAPEGILRSRVSLEGRAFDLASIKGEGEAAIENGRLYSFPILVAITSLFDLKMPTKNPVTDAYCIFTIDNGLITIEDLLFSGGSMPIYMEGFIGLQNDVDFRDQPIYMIVTLARNEGVLDRIPLLSILKYYTVDFLRRMILQARVTGTLDDYNVATMSTPFTDQIQKMLSFLEKVASLPREQR